MNRKSYLLFTLFLAFCRFAIAQSDSINWLDEVQLSDVKLKNNTEGQYVKKLSDSVIQQSEPLLTSVLKFNSPFFFRENGYGMVSSASVRGTGAAQTAVIWNGININSQFTGQTDFNTINTKVYDNISLKPGGGSVIYGSGAIGGTIHLNNEFQFDEDSQNDLRIGFGSFDTYQASYKGSFSNEKTNLKIGVSGISSENDYKYLGTEEHNENGDFYNAAVNASLGHWLGDSNIVKLYSNYYQGDRGFSGTLNLPSNSKYVDRNSRNLLEWKSFLGGFTSSLKIAWIKEGFKYFENRDSENFSFGDAETAIIKYDLVYEVSENKEINLIADYTDVKGDGTGIQDAKRKIGGISLLWSDQLEEFNYQLSLRQEIANNYDSPLLFSVGASYKFSDHYTLRFNSSRNFRMPTFNDLFWLEGGNTDLDPETSIQAEIGHGVKFKSFSVDLATYFINTDDLIRWTPDDSGVWRPGNTTKVYNYGLEVFVSWSTQLAGNLLSLSSNYAFTKAIDQETDNQLIYTPLHKATFSAGYQLNNFEILIQSLYNGSIYTSSDNNYELGSYELANLSFAYSFSTKPQLNLNVSVDNIFNEEYQSLPSRIMPGRSFNSTLTINF